VARAALSCSYRRNKLVMQRVMHSQRFVRRRHRAPARKTATSRSSTARISPAGSMSTAAPSTGSKRYDQSHHSRPAIWRTDRQYENFILEFEWFHAPSPKGSVGNSACSSGRSDSRDGTPVTLRSIESAGACQSALQGQEDGLPTATSHGDSSASGAPQCKPDRRIRPSRALPAERGSLQRRI